MKSILIQKSHISQRIMKGLMAALLCFGQASQAASVSVIDAYNKASKLYSQGQLRAAFEVAVATVKRYPDHQPSFLLLGQIMYRMGKIERAARFFRKVSPELLTGDTAYMYGVTFFSIGQCRSAKEGFLRVPENSQASNLAAFYLGICFARERQWFAAEKKLIQATPLPPHLETIRRRALEQVRNALQVERQSAPLTNNTYLYVQPPPAIPMPPMGYPPATIGPPPESIYGSKKKPPPTPLPAAGFTGAVTPSAEVSRRNFLRDFSGFRRENGETLTLFGKMSLLGRYNAEPSKGGGQAYVSVSADASLRKADTKGKGTTLEASSTAPEITAIVPSPLPASGKIDTQIYLLNPEAGYPILGLLDLTVGGRFARTRRSGVLKDDFTNQEGYGSFAFGVQTQFKGTGTYVRRVKEDGSVNEGITLLAGQLTHNVGPATLTLGGQFANRALTELPAPGVVFLLENASSTFDGNIISADGTARKNWETFSLTLAGGFKMFSVSNPAYIKNGEDSEIKLEISGVKTWDLGLTLTLTGTMFMLQDYKIDLTPPPPSPGSENPAPTPPEQKIATNGVERTKGFVSLKYAPFSFLSFALSYDVTKTSISPTKSELLPEVQKIEPSLENNFIVLLGAQTTF